MSLKTFAHLLGLPSMSRAARADDAEPPVTQDNNDDDPLDEQYAKGKKARGKRADEDEKADPDAEDDGDDADAEDDDRKDEAKAKGKARGKRADDDKPDAEDEDDDEKPSAAVAAERARCAHIMAEGIKCGQPEQAFILAFDSGLKKNAAINILRASGLAQSKPTGKSLGSRMAAVNVPNAGAGGDAAVPEGVSPMAARIIQAGQAAGPRR